MKKEVAPLGLEWTFFATFLPLFLLEKKVQIRPSNTEFSVDKFLLQDNWETVLSYHGWSQVLYRWNQVFCGPSIEDAKATEYGADRLWSIDRWVLLYTDMVSNENGNFLEDDDHHMLIQSAYPSAYNHDRLSVCIWPWDRLSVCT